MNDRVRGKNTSICACDVEEQSAAMSNVIVVKWLKDDSVREDVYSKQNHMA